MKYLIFLLFLTSCSYLTSNTEIHNQKCFDLCMEHPNINMTIIEKQKEQFVCTCAEVSE